MASWDAAQQGAATGAQTGNPYVTAGLALLAGLTGNKPSWTTPQRQQLRIANQFEQLGNAAPLSQPDEQAGLASQMGAIGQQAGQQQNQFFAAAGPQSGLTPAARADMLRNLMSSQLATQSNARMQALLQSFGQKRQALQTSAQIAGSIGPKGNPGGNPFADTVGQVAYLNALRKGPKKPGQPPDGGGGGGGGGSVDVGGQTQIGAQGVGGGGGASATSQSMWDPNVENQLAPWGISNSQQRDYRVNNFPAPAFGAGNLMGNEQPFQQQLPVNVARPAWSGGWGNEQSVGQAMLSPQDRALATLGRLQGRR